VDSSPVGYDGGQDVRNEEYPVGRKKPGRKAEPLSNRRVTWPRWRGFRGKTFWDWLQLLVVPLVLGLLAITLTSWFNAQQDARQQSIEDQRAEAERELAEQSAQDEALQAYLDQVGTLLLEKELRNSEEDSEVRTLARARTLAVLGRLDPARKTEVMQFLVEAKLIQSVKGSEPIIRLVGADLRGTSVSGEETFRGAYLGILTLTNLSGAHLSAANLSDSNLSSADLSTADLSAADLSGVEGIQNEELDQQAADLEGAIMPNGQKYENWLKSKGRGEDGKTSGPS
jgi:pentapeptide repeat protein